MAIQNSNLWSSVKSEDQRVLPKPLVKQWMGEWFQTSSHLRTSTMEEYVGEKAAAWGAASELSYANHYEGKWHTACAESEALQESLDAAQTKLVQFELELSALRDEHSRLAQFAIIMRRAANNSQPMRHFRISEELESCGLIHANSMPIGTWHKDKP